MKACQSISTTNFHYYSKPSVANLQAMVQFEKII